MTQRLDLMCIDYPGNVVNEDKAMKTLGGLERIQQAFEHRNGKLFLNFNPENIFSKLICSTQSDANEPKANTSSLVDNNSELTQDQEPSVLPKRKSFLKEPIANSLTPFLVMKVTIKKGEKSKCKLIGDIRKTFSFTKLADFQYLPMKRLENDERTEAETQTYEGFYNNFNFNSFKDYKDDFRSDIPLYVLPPFFSRFDDPVNYAFKAEPCKKKGDAEDSFLESFSDVGNLSAANFENENIEDIVSSNNEKDPSLIRSVRQERSSQAFLITFDTPDVPNEPNDKLKEPRSEHIRQAIETLRELFVQRPCYLKSALMCLTNISPSLLKETLPYVAYYFTTGPWRSCWVRYRYDPRKFPESKIYQMIDYRLRYYAEPETNLIKPKPRSAYHKRKFRSDLNEVETSDYKNITYEDTIYKFKADQLPSSRNVFYQICDIEDSDIQTVVHANDGKEKKCDEKDGWCITNIQDQCRNIMSAKHEVLAKYLASKQPKKSDAN